MAEANVMDGSDQLASSTASPAASGGLVVSPRELYYYAHYDYHDRLDEDAVATEHPSSDKRFPELLHEFLHGLSRKQQLIVSWLPHGRSFIVHNSALFVKHFLSGQGYFRFSKFASFQRQLNLYGFTRITTRPERGGYYHEYFLRNRPDLCHRIHRMKIKGVGRDPPPSPQNTDPDFSFMRPSLPRRAIQQIAPVIPEHSHFSKESGTVEARDGIGDEEEKKPDSMPV